MRAAQLPVSLAAGRRASEGTSRLQVHCQLKPMPVGAFGMGLDLPGVHLAEFEWGGVMDSQLARV